MLKCNGEERHSHFVLSSGELFLHTHQHNVNENEFNRLHHHAPLEHDGLTTEQLEKDGEYIKVPF